MWVINAVRHGVAIAALAQYNVITILDPATWVVANLAFASLLILRRRRAHRPVRRDTRKRTTRHK